MARWGREARSNVGRVHTMAKNNLQHVGRATGPEINVVEGDKHYASRSGQTSPATAVANITKPVTKINFGPGTLSQKQ